MMKNRLLLCLCVLPMVVAAQTIQVGDSVRVKRTTETYLTGERISAWVYEEAHMVSQVGTRQYADGVLLDISGARSWLGQNDVVVLGREPQPAPAPAPVPESVPAPEPVVVHEPEPMVEPAPVVESEPVALPEPEPEIVVAPVPVPMVESEPEIPVEKPEPKKVKVEKQPIEIVPNNKSFATFQMIGDMGVLVGNYTYGLNADMIFGARLNSFVFVGGGVGLHGWLSGLDKYGHSALLLPVFADARGYLPIVGKNFTPYMELSLGASLGMLDKYQEDKLKKTFNVGLYTRVGVGLEFNMWSISLGYDYGTASTAWLGWSISLTSDN